MVLILFEALNFLFYADGSPIISLVHHEVATGAPVCPGVGKLRSSQGLGVLNPEIVAPASAEGPIALCTSLWPKLWMLLVTYIDTFEITLLMLISQLMKHIAHMLEEVASYIFASIRSYETPSRCYALWCHPSSAVIYHVWRREHIAPTM